jgi:2-oxoglutarate ferredoxin oxidoreductase subunit delta
VKSEAIKNVRGTVSIDAENCKGCELCIEACPQESLALSPKINGLGYRYVVLVQDNCTGCINCALVCPDTVIKVYRSAKKSKPAAGEPAARQAARPAGPASAPTAVGRVDL